MSEWYYAHDGAQHGPVPLSELERLVSLGEFDPDKDLVWREGMSDWKLASGLDEFKTLGQSASNQLSTDESPSQPAATPRDDDDPYATPGARPDQNLTNIQGPLEEIEPGSEPLDIGVVISTSFELTKRHIGQMIGIGLLMIGISLVTGMIMGGVDLALGLGPAEPADFGYSSGNENADKIFTSALGGSSWLANLVSFVVDMFLGLGIIRVGLQIIDHQPYSVSTLFSQGQRTISGCVANILYMLIALAVPGFIFGFAAASGSTGMMIIAASIAIPIAIYLSIRFSQYQYAIVDRSMGAIASLKYSSELTRGNRLKLFYLFVLTVVINLGGALALLVGLIFTIPLTTLMLMVGFRWLQYGSAVARDPRDRDEWNNW